jgi:ketopantoate reductase
MKVLVVGAGAVGQVYGLYFERGGADVSFYVKPKYVPHLKAGLTLFPLNQGKNPPAIRLKNYRVISELHEVAQTMWDVVLLTVPSDALYSPWLSEFSSQINTQATIISLQPGHNDRQELLKYFPEKNVIPGVITLISFATPLDASGPQENGMAFWFPPLTKAFFDGESTVVSEIIRILNAGGFPAARKKLLDDPGFVYFGSTFLNLFIRNLELNEWELGAFHNDEVSKLLKDSTLEGFEVVSKKFSLSTPFFKHFLGKTFYNLAIKLALKMMPFDLEKYLKIHFTKVAPQMRKNLHDLISEGHKYNLPLKALIKLR